MNQMANSRLKRKYVRSIRIHEYYLLKAALRKVAMLLTVRPSGAPSFYNSTLEEDEETILWEGFEIESIEKDGYESCSGSTV